MKYRYPNISKAYTGSVCREAELTLNAQFYALFHRAQLPFDVVFPQRVPRIDYFLELEFLEVPHFKLAFERCLAPSLECLKQYKDEVCDRSSLPERLFHMNYLLRQGRFEDICSLSPKVEGEDSLSLEFALLVETARIELDLCAARAPNLQGLTAMANTVQRLDVSVTQKMRVVNRLIVYASRHTHDDSVLKLAVYVDYLWTLLETFCPQTFVESLACSVAYRGIAMSDHLDITQREYSLARCESIARELSPSTIAEAIIASENLYNVLQTLSKWAMLHESWAEAEKFLSEMVVLDPLDSAAFTEWGILMMRLGRYDEAISHFQKAVALGPAGVAMNTFFLGEVWRKLGDCVKAQACFNETIKLDPESISPYLSLLSLHESLGDKKQAGLVARRILSNELLVRQLEGLEVEKLREYAR